jgi:hypothetical protein
MRFVLGYGLADRDHMIVAVIVADKPGSIAS